MTAGSPAKSILEEASNAVQSKRPILKHKFEGHKVAIWGFVFLHDNIHIVSGSLDGSMRKWNCNTGLVVGEPWKGEGGKIHALVLSPDGKIIACGRGDGSVQRWTTDGEVIEGVWTGHSEWVRSLAWSPSGSHIASGSEDGTILIRRVDNGGVDVRPINTEQTGVWSLAYSPSGGRIASGGFNKSICIWDTKTGKLVVGPITDMGNCYVTSVVWSSDSAKLYSASDRFARVFDSTSGRLLHSFAHNDTLYSVALSPKNNVLACVGLQGIAQLWDIESHQSLGQPFRQEHHERLLCVSFSRDGKYVAYSGDDNKLTLWLVKDIASPHLEPALHDGQSTREETQSDSPPLSSCLDGDATGGDGFIAMAHDDPYNNFFQKSLPSPSPSPSPSFNLPPLFSARRLWNVVSRHRQLPDKSVPKEHSKRGFFSRRTRLKSPLEHMEHTIKPIEGEGDEKQRETVDVHDSANDMLSATKYKSNQQDDPPAIAKSPSSYDCIPSTPLDSKNDRKFWERLMQARGINSTSSSLHTSTRLANSPQRRIRRNPWHWSSSLFPAGSSIHPVDVAACRDEDRYGIAPESDAEAAAAMLRTNDDVADNSTRPGQPAVGARLSQGQSTQTQASTIGPGEIEVSCCGFVFSCRRRSNLHQP
ncbi:hypothetical protein CY34DRAFT_712108 [Suillus luteus UH-Slu-Lm8-n1]|uniref:WD40 repeat-like protein n=1 Tax=Suillus luteus UH-Slu-Lm8-n1 TaxID=930992 RepID=A0A0D0ANJ3_9AGAM|nr:hypothetical protein CY34DRAFT_712108 [Suillus luteus UH-Slu-Lm8-n1]